MWGGGTCKSVSEVFFMCVEQSVRVRSHACKERGGWIALLCRRSNGAAATPMLIAVAQVGRKRKLTTMAGLPPLE